MVVEQTAGFKGRLPVSKYLLHSGVPMLDIPRQKSVPCITYLFSLANAVTTTVDRLLTFGEHLCVSKAVGSLNFVQLWKMAMLLPISQRSKLLLTGTEQLCQILY